MLDFLRLVDRFRKDKRANVAVTFTIALLPVVSAIGCAIDYTRATAIRAKLQAAIDAASVGSIAKTSPAFVAAGNMSSDGPIAVGSTDATNIFNGNMSGVGGYTLNSMTPVVSQVRRDANLHHSVLGQCSHHVSRCHGQEHDDRYRRFAIERCPASLSRFLSGAGCVGIDGPALDTGRSRADAGN